MNRRVEFWEAPEVVEEDGNLAGALVKKYDCWAEVKPIKGMVALEYNKVYGQIGWMIKIRQGNYMPSSQTIVKLEGSDYVLTSTPEAMDRRFLTMHIVRK